MDCKNNGSKNKVIPLFVRPGGGAAVEVAVAVGGTGGRRRGGRREMVDVNPLRDGGN